MIKRKEFEVMFLPHIQSETQIWVVHKINKLPIEIIRFALILAALDFINYVRIDDKTVAASGENHPKRPQVPLIQINHPTLLQSLLRFFISGSIREVIFMKSIRQTKKMAEKWQMPF
jgi:hypothetical protein